MPSNAVNNDVKSLLLEFFSESLRVSVNDYKRCKL
jgi:hypothetical protein